MSTGEHARTQDASAIVLFDLDSQIDGLSKKISETCGEAVRDNQDVDNWHFWSAAIIREYYCDWNENWIFI